MTETHFVAGIGFALLGGILQGAMLWPMKFMDKWQWENSWLGFSFAAYLVAPWVLAFWTVPHLAEALGEVTPRALGLTFLFGLGWGIGTVLFGLGIAMLGLGLGYAIIMGLTVSVGTLAPLVLRAPQEVFSRRGLVLLFGVAAIIVGIILCSYAGKLREKKLGVAVPQRGTRLGGFRSSYGVGLAVCIFAGLLIPGGNLALTLGSEITQRARELGATDLGSVNALWAVAISPLFLTSAAYCLFLMRRGNSFRTFRQPGTGYYWLLVAIMGAVQMAGIALYGFGAASLGVLGTSIGFPILMSSMIISANTLGVVSGEWKGAGGRPASMMAAGLVLLTGAIFFIGYGTRPGV